MMSFLREWLDRLLLSDHEWKKKYCPHLWGYLCGDLKIDWDAVHKKVEQERLEEKQKRLLYGTKS